MRSSMFLGPFDELNYEWEGRRHRSNSHVLARGGNALQEFEVVVRLDAALFDPLAQHVERRQVAGVGRVQNRYHHLGEGRHSVPTDEEAGQCQESVKC